MATARSIFRSFVLLTALAGMVGCMHGHARAQYEIVDASLVRGGDTLVDLGRPAATYETSLVRRGGSQFLVRESFTNEKSLLLVELLPGRSTGRVISIHRSLMTTGPSGAPAWSGVEVLDSEVPLDDGLWDRVFELTASLPAPRPDGVPAALLGTTMSVRTFKHQTPSGEYRMFSPTAPESPLDPLRLGSLPKCSERLKAGGAVDFAVVTQDQGIIDVVVHRSADGEVTGTYRALGASEYLPLKGEHSSDGLTLRTMDGHIVFDGRGEMLLFTGHWMVPGRESVAAVLGCAEL